MVGLVREATPEEIETFKASRADTGALPKPRVVVKCMLTDHYLSTVQRLAADAITLGWELVGISSGKMGSLSSNEYLITIKAIVGLGEDDPKLPTGWKSN